MLADLVSAPIHLHPTGPLAERVLLPGDPGRALRLAEGLLQTPKMFNHNRGLWGYTGTAADGELLTIQSTGMGGPSAAIVIAELHDLGARTMVRVGTCAALHPALVLGELLVVTEALSADGTSRRLGAGERVSGDSSLLERLTAACGAGTARGPVVSTDLFYDGREGEEHDWLEQGARAVEMEVASLFALAARRNFAAGAVLIVSDVLSPQRTRIDTDALTEAELRLGTVAAAALAPEGTSAGPALAPNADSPRAP
ncbi:MAG: purine-nucleoside phosphorylase [Candidatus Dormibacteria bacterium]